MEDSATVNTVLRQNTLHLFSLAALVVAQPIFDLLSKSPEFFTIRGIEFRELLLLISLILFLLPAGLSFLEALLRSFSVSMQQKFHVICMFSLFSLGLSRVVAGITVLSVWKVLILIVLCALVITFAYQRFQGMRLFVTFLSPAVIIVPALFLLNPGVKGAFKKELPTLNIVTKPNNPVSVVMLVFDEFPISSLMNDKFQIDKKRFPNFFSLAQDSYWFRNATTVSDGTELAVPPILTGRYPKKRLVPSYANYPENLFTLLAPSHQLQVVETQTKLCPRSLCPLKKEDTLSQRLSEWMVDLFIVYLHTVFPAEMRADLPNISQSWGGFLKNRGGKSDLKDIIENVASDNRPLLLRNFFSSIRRKEKPGFYFLHVLFPHVPWKYLPSGKVYTADYVEGLFVRDRWKNEEWASVDGLQRHLLQVQYLDLLIGELISHLKKEGIYDEVLIVLTADHGVSFQAGDKRRALTETNYYDILPVPFFLKLPNQHKEVINDSNVETTDIVPTISDILGLTMPWPVDGLSVFSPEIKGRATKHFYRNDLKKEKIPSTFEDKVLWRSPTIDRLSKLFNPGKEGYDFYSTSFFNDLLGENLSEFVIAESNNSCSLNEEPFFKAVNTHGAILPAHITGRILLRTPKTPPLPLALSINGVVQGVTKSVEDRGDERTFSFLVPETAFQDGDNKVEVFEVSKTPERPVRLMKLQPEKIDEFQLFTSAEGKESLRLEGDEIVQIRPQHLRGALDSVKVRDGRVVFTGWAVDAKRNERAAQILIFADGRFVGSGKTSIVRKDLTKRYGLWAETSGFMADVPFSLLGTNSKPTVRLFALSKEGYASELQYFKDYQWSAIR